MEESSLRHPQDNDGGEFFETPTGQINQDQRMKAVARARHETINRKLKQFGCLARKWRHSKEKHGSMFMAVANITHMVMSVGGLEELEHGQFQVNYKDN